ncbi:MAG: hypothetical protein GY765_19175 [bacterium]|nr:hypothetical protein [bacterium]
MPRTSLETTDIYRGAYFISSGCDLCGVRFMENGSPKLAFRIEGDGLDKLDKDYRNGQALVNPLQLREALNHLRDVLFSKLNGNGRKRYDRNRKKTRRYHS